MSVREQRRDIPRVWEVDWRQYAGWSAYEWALARARDTGADLYIVASLYSNFENLRDGIGHQAAGLVAGPHEYVDRGVLVKGVTFRGRFYARGVVLLCWATDETLADVEGGRPEAVAAVASWPSDIRQWRSLHEVPRIGHEEADAEAEVDADQPPVSALDPRAKDALRSAGAGINKGHSVLTTWERERVAGALLAIRAAGLAAEAEAIRGFLMAEGWPGTLIEQVVKLADRVERGERPRSQPFGTV